VLLDTEHSPNELPMVQSQLHAMTGGTATPVVRPAWNDMVLVKRYLDMGYLFVAVGADTGMLVRGSDALAAKFRS